MAAHLLPGGIGANRNYYQRILQDACRGLPAHESTSPLVCAYSACDPISNPGASRGLSGSGESCGFPFLATIRFFAAQMPAVRG